jgi:hypothetical protein
MIGLRVTAVVVEDVKEDRTPFDKVIRFKPISDAWKDEQGITVEAVRLANISSIREATEGELSQAEVSSQQATKVPKRDDIEY